MGTLVALAAVIAFGGGCVGSGDLETTVSGQIVGIDNQFLGPGLVLFERGLVHAGAYERGALIDDEGRFTIVLPEGGTWGIHLFRDEYQYLPMEVSLDDKRQIVLTSMMVSWGVWMDLSGRPTWPDQPADQTLIRMPWDDTKADNPELLDVQMAYVGPDLLEITAEVIDPDGDLSRMILAHDHATGAGYALNPPGPPDGHGDYPDGTYTLKVYLDDRHEPGVSVWSFVVSDNLCNDSDILELTLPEAP